MSKEHMQRRRVVQLLTWLAGIIFLAVAVVVTLVYLIPKVPILDVPPNDPRLVTIYRFAAVVFIILLYGVAWVIRGVYSDTKDSMICDMGDIELAVLKAQIEQVLEARKNE